MPQFDAPQVYASLAGFAVALGIGLLIGAERERRNTEPGTAGIRSFSVAALAGAVGFALGGMVLLAVVAGGCAALAVAAYLRGPRERPGMTTGVTLILTALLGGLAVEAPVPAAALGVTVAVLLAARTPLHRFVRQVLTEDELRDGLTFAAATLVILPLLPDQAVGPFDVLNPRRIWIVVILVMAIGGTGHIAVRALGARFGLPLAGFAGGFVSSTATIGAMGAKAAKAPELLATASAGAILSTVATVIQLALLIGATSLAALEALALPLGGAAVAAIGYGAAFTLPVLRRPPESEPPPGRPFRPATALLFALMLAAILFASAALQAWLGEAGLLLATFLSGFADTHAPAISAAALAGSGHMAPQGAVLPVLAAFSSNTVSKIAFAAAGGGRAFALRVVPGLLLVAAGAWAGWLLESVL
ncbi:MgtC/SapB family protein [Ferrovibrio xuzhouensis]|uniref:MgtC/SapB family protein n=1 Tax=Ferrovibrio xuzhouensis TaxID=1576914 RepID=A0ABV7VLK5_9PROT